MMMNAMIIVVQITLLIIILNNVDYAMKLALLALGNITTIVLRVPENIIISNQNIYVSQIAKNIN